MIRLNDIVVKFGDFTALHSINVHVKEGEFFTFLGPSGCGKTTTLRTITGFIEPAEGSVVVKGRDITRVPIEDRNIGIVFQSYALFPTMTVYDNIAFGLKVKKAKKDEIDRKVREAAEILDITQYLDRKPKALSGGQRQRVAIGRAIVRDPKVFLMDEPLSNLDAKLRNQMRAEIIKLREKIDTTFIYVTHDQVEAMTLGDRIVIMRDGFIQQIGTPQEVFNHPATLFVAGFIGTPQMNFFEDCRLTKNGDAYSVTIMGHTLPLTAEQNEKLAAAGAESRTVTIGVRPVHVTVGDEGIDAQIDVSELMGSELHLHMTAGGKDVVAVVQTANLDPNAYARHTAVRFSFEPRLIHLFDPETEKNLI